MQSSKESFWEQAGIAIALLVFGIYFCLRWLLINRSKWLIEQTPKRRRARKIRGEKIKILEGILGLKKRDENAIYYDPCYYKHFTPHYERYEDDSFWGSCSYATKRERYLEELKVKMAAGWKDPEIVVSVRPKLYHQFTELAGSPTINYHMVVAIKKNSCYDCGQKKLKLLKHCSLLHLDECGNPMDYKVIWELDKIEDYKGGNIVDLKQKKEIIEFLNSLQKIDKSEKKDRT